MRLLDLYCGEGLAAWGYWLSGCFSEIVGVDHDPAMRTRYAFDFICADVLRLDYDFLLSFDAIHASPPCQAYSKITPDRSRHPRLIKPTLLMLHAAGKPFVVENVEGSGAELRPNLRLSGFDVGLPSRRVRYFRVGVSSAAAANLSIDDRPNPGAHAETISIHGRRHVCRADVDRAMGLGDIPELRRARLTRRGIEQGIPPPMTRWIASRLFSRVLVG